MADINALGIQDGVEYPRGSITVTKNAAGRPDEQRLIDGSVATYDECDAETYTLDLGSNQELCKIQMYVTNDLTFIVKTSTDNATWTRVMHVDKDNEATAQQISLGQYSNVYINPTISARYIQLVGLVLNSYVHEVKVFTTTSARNFVCTSDDGNFDGVIDSADEVRRRMWTYNTSRPWSLLGYGKYAQWDLGEIKTVNQVDEYLAATNENHTVKISVNGSDWTTLYNSGSNPTGWNIVTNNLPAEARYVKVDAISNTYLRQVRVWTPDEEVVTTGIGLGSSIGAMVGVVG